MYHAHITRSDIAPLLGYTGAVMTLAKTLLYISQEYFCSGCAVGHNTLFIAFCFWILPNLYVFFISTGLPLNTPLSQRVDNLQLLDRVEIRKGHHYIDSRRTACQGELIGAVSTSLFSGI